MYDDDDDNMLLYSTLIQRWLIG